MAFLMSWRTISVIVSAAKLDRNRVADFPSLAHLDFEFA